MDILRCLKFNFFFPLFAFHIIINAIKEVDAISSMITITPNITPTISLALSPVADKSIGDVVELSSLSVPCTESVLDTSIAIVDAAVVDTSLVDAAIVDTVVVDVAVVVNAAVVVDPIVDAANVDTVIVDVAVVVDAAVVVDPIVDAAVVDTVGRGQVLDSACQ